jgi:leader peptidase (prepilin peptidase) / N-methyltransferase
MSADARDVRAVHIGDGIFVAVPAPPHTSVPSPPPAAEPDGRRWHVPRAALVPAAALGAAAFVRVGASPRGVMAAALLAVLVVLSAIDLRWRLLPNRIVLPATAVALLGQLAISPAGAPVAMAAALGAGALLLLPNVLNPAGIGMGDVKLAALLGAALGTAVVSALFVGFLAMGAAAGALLVRHGRAARQKAIPLGPFLAFGAAVAVLV